MEWYWIVLIVVGYIFMIVLTAVLLNRFTQMRNDKAGCIFLGLIWPLTIIVLPFMFCAGLVHWAIDRVAKKWDEEEKKHNCKHYFGRVVKDKNGIPYDYWKGCFAGCDPKDCGTCCKKYEPNKKDYAGK